MQPRAERSLVRFMRHESWDNALFLHYPVDAARLQSKLPDGLVVDEHQGVAYVGIVLLTERGITPCLPGVPQWMVEWLSMSHHAVNVRTYVRPAKPAVGPPGIFFFTLECSALLPAVGAHLLFNLPYRWARMDRGRRDSEMTLESSRVVSTASVSATWRLEDEQLRQEEAELGRFFVERYALYNTPGPLLRLVMGASRLWSGVITHEPWPLRRVRLVAHEGLCSSLLSSVGLSELVRGGDGIAHASSGVGPIEFFWQGGIA